jgi:hypothetical protein
MARGAGTKLVNSIVKRIEAKHAYQKTAGKKGEAKRSPSPATQRSGYVPANLRA